MNVAIVGAGRVGRALGCFLRRRGWRIGAVVTRSAATARAAARAIGAGQPQVFDIAQRRKSDHGEKTIRAIHAADIILISTPDAAIASVASQLAQMTPAKEAPGKGRVAVSGRLATVSGRHKNNWRRKIVLHTCGALDRGVLRPLERRGASTGSLHPLQTFGKNSLPKLKGVACAIEGGPAALRAAQRICRELGCVPIRVPRGGKPAYHAAAVFAAGHILAVMEAATRILMATGFSRQQAVHALLPLTCQTLANFERTGGPASGSPGRVVGSGRAHREKVEPAAFWTGPAARGDLATIRKHVAALRRFPPEYRAAYAALTRLSILLLARPRSSARQN